MYTPKISNFWLSHWVNLIQSSMYLGISFACLYEITGFLLLPKLKVLNITSVILIRSGHRDSYKKLSFLS